MLHINTKIKRQYVEGSLLTSMPGLKLSTCQGLGSRNKRLPMCMGWHKAQYHNFCNATMALIRWETKDGLVVPGLHHDIKTTSSITWISETDTSLKRCKANWELLLLSTCQTKRFQIVYGLKTSGLDVKRLGWCQRQMRWNRPTTMVTGSLFT